jgi:hypothetical protein
MLYYSSYGHMEQMIGNYVSGVQGLDRRTQVQRLLRGDDSGSGNRGGHLLAQTRERGWA